MMEYLGNKELLKQHKRAFLASSTIPPDMVLIISTSTAVRQSKVTALARNKYICELADDILFVGVMENSSLYYLKQEYIMKSISPLSITSTADAKHHRWDWAIS